MEIPFDPKSYGFQHMGVLVYLLHSHNAETRLYGDVATDYTLERSAFALMKFIQLAWISMDIDLS